MSLSLIDPTVPELAIELASELHETEMFNRISIDRDYELGTCSVTVMRKIGLGEFTFKVNITEEDRINPIFSDRMVHKITEAMTYDACRNRLLYGKSTHIEV